MAKVASTLLEGCKNRNLLVRCDMLEQACYRLITS